LNCRQAAVWEILINNDLQIKADTARGTVCKVTLLTTKAESEQNLSLRDEIARLDADINRRRDEHYQTALDSV